jgi:hypothetical protein
MTTQDTVGTRLEVRNSHSIKDDASRYTMDAPVVVAA